MRYWIQLLLTLMFAIFAVITIIDAAGDYEVNKVEYQRVNYNYVYANGLIIDYDITDSTYGILYRGISPIYNREKYFIVNHKVLDVKGYINNVCTPLNDGWDISDADDTIYGYMEIKTNK